MYCTREILHLYLWRKNKTNVPAVGPEQDVLQGVCGAVGCGDEAEEEEDEVRHAEEPGQLLVEDLFPERHLQLRVLPEPVPAHDILFQNRKSWLKGYRAKSVVKEPPCSTLEENTYFSSTFEYSIETFLVDFAREVIKAGEKCNQVCVRTKPHGTRVCDLN